MLCGGAATAQSFDSLKWENRVLVLSADDNSPQAREQILLLSDFYQDMEDRELIVLRLTSQVLRKVDELSPFPFQTQILENSQHRRYLQSLFSSEGFLDGGLRVTLVGIDGELKEMWDGVIEPAEIFEAIDAMPMRQREINQ